MSNNSGRNRTDKFLDRYDYSGHHPPQALQEIFCGGEVWKDNITISFNYLSSPLPLPPFLAEVAPYSEVKSKSTKDNQIQLLQNTMRSHSRL